MSEVLHLRINSWGAQPPCALETPKCLRTDSQEIIILLSACDTIIIHYSARRA